jgi:hypothetical protein
MRIFPLPSRPAPVDSAILCCLLSILLAVLFPAPGRTGASLPFSGEQLTFDVTFLNIPVVTARLEAYEVGYCGDEPVVHLAVTGYSTPFYSLLYPVDNRYDTYFTWPSARTLRYSRSISEPGVELQRTIRYENGLALTEGQDPRPVPSGVRDLFTALFALRGYSLDDGQVIESTLDLDGQIWIARTEVLGRETIETGLGEHDAVKVLIRFEPMDPDGSERPDSDVMTNNLVKKKTKLTFWFSDDDLHLPLRAEYRMAPFSLKTVLRSVE